MSYLRIANHDDLLLAGSGVDDVEIEPTNEQWAEAEQAHTTGPMLLEAFEAWERAEEFVIQLRATNADFAQFAKDHHETSIRLRAIECMERDIQRSKDDEMESRA